MLVINHCYIALTKPKKVHAILCEFLKSCEPNPQYLPNRLRAIVFIKVVGFIFFMVLATVVYLPPLIAY